ncbi:hypothetical protein ASPSYDRAFT_1138309 [Aspergillus sydowii CBS 593.65]|uniref:Uncharacterized protein n=1 Tax=Aspergillus sydowii CBS 593.65 TaxID=1036612 RepID=A0A1L9TAH5_9EURO|nr:uncharacterized protein ASPSYDRAFT_1138309 [Aspergillus sydowii CBS 593.65]OJJ56416.1 hypothetical protein ASPSYDRAFT_1138309 [Aspergillus sydowii CBS 593.65]
MTSPCRALASTTPTRPCRLLPCTKHFPCLTIHVPPADGPFTAVEYGCAQGANSILPFQGILKAWHRHKKKVLQSSLFPFNNIFTACFTGRHSQTGHKQHHQEALLTFSDRESNDFNTLIQTVSQTTWLPDTKLPPPIFTAIAPGTFYSCLVPANTVSAGFSPATLHHLQRLSPPSDIPSPPPSPESDPNPNPADPKPEKPEINVVESQAKSQAHAELTTFLTHRATEFWPGGTLVVSLVSRASTGVPN